MTVFALPEERRQQIIHMLMQEGKVTAPDLSERLSVSADTIRRDLKDLEHGGHLTRVHGGALPRSPSVASYDTRQTQNISAKVAVAKAAAKLIQPNQVVVIDSGTTSLEVARHLAPDLKATVITTSPPVLIALSVHPHIHVIMLGGSLDKTSMTVMGASTQEALNRIRADVCVLGVCSLHEDIGITTNTYEEAEMKRLMIHNSAEVIAATTAEKLGTATPFVVTSLDHISHIVTEASVSDEMLRPYKDLGISTLKAKA